MLRVGRGPPRKHWAGTRPGASEPDGSQRQPVWSWMRMTPRSPRLGVGRLTRPRLQGPLRTPSCGPCLLRHRRGSENPLGATHRKGRETAWGGRKRGVRGRQEWPTGSNLHSRIQYIDIPCFQNSTDSQASLYGVLVGPPAGQRVPPGLPGALTGRVGDLLHSGSPRIPFPQRWTK